MPSASNADTACRRGLPAAVLFLALALPTHVGAQGDAVIEGNEVSCLVLNTGKVCEQHAPGLWPIGTPNQYIFEAGVQVAGLIGEGAPASWVGDTIPAYFYDVVGSREHGAPLTPVFSSRRAADLGSWPRAGAVDGFPFAGAWIEADDPFHVMHAGNPVASDQDTWSLFWEGESRLNAIRPHPLGIAVEQRTLQWNAPEGLQSSILVVYRITNVSALPVFRDSIARAFFEGDTSAVPASGWTIDSLFVGFAMDADVTTDAPENATLLMPGFQAVTSYHAQFVAPEFEFPASVFYPPFFGTAPGMVASALLRAEGDGDAPAARMMSMLPLAGGCIGCDADPAQLWRLLSGHVDLCTFPDPIEAGVCYARQVPGDVKHYQSVGPWTLAPGEAATVVFAIVMAPSVEVEGIVIGSDNAPGLPTQAPGCDGEPINPVARAAGWLSTPVCPAPGERLDPDLVETVPGSLLDRIQVARAFAQAGFLEASPPVPPTAHVLPGDSSITVIWTPSPTESAAGADPFYQLASDSGSALFNPNFRPFDVEGYRVYRSTDGSNWRELAQFDSDTTVFADYICETADTVAAGEPCSLTTAVQINDLDWNGELIFYRPGDVVRAPNGSLAVLGGERVSAGHGRLLDTGVPFFFEDTDVRPGFRYFYQVRAFDVNSSWSGPSSQESSSRVVSAIVQRDFSNLVEPELTIRLEGADGRVLRPEDQALEIDAEDGTFDGPVPPTDALVARMEPALTDLLPAMRIAVRIDSVRLGPTEAAPCSDGTNIQAMCWRLFHTVDRDGTVESGFTDGYTPAIASLGDFEWQGTLAAVEFEADPATTELLEMPDAFRYRARIDVVLRQLLESSAAEGQLTRRVSPFAAHTAGGSRWFDGTEETVPDPARFIRVGHLEAVDTVWAPIHHTDIGDGTTYPTSVQMQCFSYAGASIARAADLRVTWDDGTIEVEDVTHGVPVQFKPSVQQNWGFLRDGNGNGMLDWLDFDHVDGVAPLIRNLPFCSQPPEGSETQLAATPQVMATSTQGGETFTATGTGFGLYINGQRFIFETPGGQLPPNGTVWTLRTYHGRVRAEEATTDDPTDYDYVPGFASYPMVPGLTVVFEVEEARHFEGAPDLARVHTVPDPFYYHARFGSSEQGHMVRFVNLPPQATIRIYTITGILVDVVQHDDPLSGIATWDLRTRDGHGAASGVYFFHVTAPGGHEQIGRFTIVTSGRYVQ